MKQVSAKDGFYLFALLLITTIIFGVYIWLAAQNHFPQIEPMINGTAARPFVYRVLPSYIIKNISNIFGISFFLSAITVMYVSLIGFSFTLLVLVNLFLPTQHARSIALFAPIGLLPFLIYQRHIYDFPTLFLFTLALYFLAKDNLKIYIIIFTLATLTKETALFLFIFFLLQFRSMGVKKLAFWSIIHIAIYSTLRFGIIYLFRNNPGTAMEFHFYDHINAYRQYPELALILFLTLFIIATITVLQTRDKTNFLRNSLIAIGGPTFVLYMLSGVPFEIRVFLEAYPSTFLSIALAVTVFIERLAPRRKGSTSIS